MYTDVSSLFKQIHDNTGRTFVVNIVYNSGTDILPDENSDILSLKLVRGNSELDDITIGDVSSAMFTAEFTYHEATLAKLKNGTTVQLYLGLDFESDDSADEFVPMGEFKVDTVARNGNKITVTFVDKLYNSDSIYTSFLVYPVTAVDVVQELCNSLGIGYELSFSQKLILTQMTFDAAPVNVTKRQMLSYIASFMGQNAYLNRDGKLEFGWYDFVSHVTVTDDEIETPTLGELVEITALVCGVGSETTLMSGEGRALTFENPYMTQSRLDSLRRDISYYPCEMKQLVGSVLLDFDVLAYGDYLIPIMSSELTFDGGVTLSVKSAGKTAEEAATKTVTPFDVVLEQAKKYASDAIKNTTDIMNGVNGGYKIERYDADGNPYATLWMDAPDELTATHCIMINNSGIAFGSKTSGKTEWTFIYGWTIDGQFNTEYINGSRLEIMGEISDTQDGTAGDKKFGLHYEISSKLELPTSNGKTFNASGLKAWNESEDGGSSKTYFTNWGMFLDNSEEDSITTSVIAALVAVAGNMNYFGNGGFFIQDSNGNNISGYPGTGFNTTGSVGAKKVDADEVFCKDNLCLSESTGVMANIGTRLSDCNYPSAGVGQVSVDSFGSSTLHLPFSGSVGYIITLYAKNNSTDYLVQFGIRYRNNQIKMRTYNKVNANSDGTTSAWSDWSENFVTSDVTDDLFNTITTLVDGVQYQLDHNFVAEFDSYTQKGYDTSQSGVIKNWGTATIGKLGTTITFDWPHETKNYAVCITPFGKACSVYYTAPSKTGMIIYADSDDTPVSWMTVGL